MSETEGFAVPVETLGPAWTIVQAAELQHKLLQLLDTPEGWAEVTPVWHLDLSRVEEFDSAGLQLLLALKHSLRAREQQLNLRQASPVLRAALQIYALDEQLQPLHAAVLEEVNA